jgi:hypothetical protein
MFPPAPTDLFFAQWYKRYGKSTLVKCKGDGEIATCGSEEFAKGLEKIGEDERGMIQVKCLGPECIYQKSNECARMASLQVILPDLKGMGIWQINTGSYNSIVNVNSAIDWLRGLCGRYAMIPVTLMRVETEIAYEGKKSKHYILAVDQNSFSIGDIQQWAALKTVERALIPAPDESKDALFYDANGVKTAELPAPEEPKNEEKPVSPTVEPEKTAQDGQQEAPKEQQGITGQAVSAQTAPAAPAQPKGGLTDMFDKDQASRKKLSDLIKAIKGIKKPYVKEYLGKLKAEGHIEQLIEPHKQELREWCRSYLLGAAK